MNIAVKPENINSGGDLAGKTALVTGSTSGIGLGSNAAASITGAALPIDGGWTAHEGRG